MQKERNIASFIREHKRIFIIMGVALFLIELEIFAIAAMKSGRKARLQVLDHGGQVIYESDGQQLSDFNRYYFEKTFGPLEDYEIRLLTSDQPFPFRAWFVAAVGLPVGVILLTGFAIKAYHALFYGDQNARSDPAPGTEGGASRFERLSRQLTRMNIFVIGFLIFLTVFAYWVVPNLLTYLGRVSVDTLVRYKWFFLTTALAVLGLIVWIIYLRYLLALRTIDSQADIEKQRLQLEMVRLEKAPPQLEQGTDKQPRVDWQSSNEVYEGEFQMAEDDCNAPSKDC